MDYYRCTIQSQQQLMDPIEQKQQFLRVEILEAGYDPEDFIEFMSTYSPVSSPSIQNLTFAQLLAIVTAYKQEVERRNIQAQKQRQPQQQKPASQGQETDNRNTITPQKVKNFEEKKNKVEYDKYGTFDYEFKGTMNCIEADRLVKEEKIHVTVPEMETKETEGYLFGIGSKVQYYYHIKSNLIKGSVKRLSEDFDWLNSTLLRLYPFLVLPELEPVRKDISDPYIRRQKDIEQYLQHLCQKQYLMHSYVFVDFLTLSSEKMEKYKKSFDSMGFAKGVSLMKTEKGVVDLDLSTKTRELFLNSRQFSRKTALLHQNLTQAINKMIESYRAAVSETYIVVDMFAELHDVFGEVTNKFPLFKKQEYNDTLVNLNNLFLGIGDNVKSMVDTIEQQTKDYYRFYGGLDRSMQRLQKLVKDSESDYLDFKATLQRKKERVISDPSKWDLDSRDIDTKKMGKDELMKYILPKEMLAENELKCWYAFNLKNYENELGSYLKFVTRRYQKVFRAMALKLLGNDKLYLESITKFISDVRKSENSGPSQQLESRIGLDS